MTEVREVEVREVEVREVEVREVEVREVTAGDWQLMRDIRLDALREAPDAFESTYAREAAFTEADWRRRAGSHRGFLAYLAGFGAVPAGIVGGIEETPGTAQLVSMWVRPQARGRHVGTALVAAVVSWARAQGVGGLWVTEGNEPARVLYERCGFTPTGERQPLPSGPARAEIAMSLPL